MDQNLMNQANPSEQDGKDPSRNEIINRAMGVNDLMTMSDREQANEKMRDQLIENIVKQVEELKSEVAEMKQKSGMGSESQDSATAQIGMPPQSPDNVADQIASSILQQQQG